MADTDCYSYSPRRKETTRVYLSSELSPLHLAVALAEVRKDSVDRYGREIGLEGKDSFPSYYLQEEK